MDNFLVSIGTLAGTVMTCQVLRLMARDLLQPPCPRRQVGSSGQRPGPLLSIATELFSTLQLCICTHELRLLGMSGVLPGKLLALALIYLITLVHVSTFSGASCNPLSSLEQFLDGQCSGQLAIFKVLAQLAAASVAHSVTEMVWALHMSDMHQRHPQVLRRCASALNTSTLSSGMFVEFACAFSLRAVTFRFQRLGPTLKKHLVAGLITFLVFAAGDLTGAVFNPALAYSITFNCEGNTLLEYIFVYWLGPVMGTLTAVMLFDKKLGNSTSMSVQTPHTRRKRD